MSDLFHKDVPDDYIARSPRHAAGELAHLSGADKAVRPAAQTCSGPNCASRRKSLTSGGASALRTAGTACRASISCASHPPQCGSCRSSRCWKTSARIDLDRHRLGDRRRRERTGRAPDGRRVGAKHPRPMPCRRRGVLLQAMGRRSEIRNRKVARRSHLQRVSGTGADRTANIGYSPREVGTIGSRTRLVANTMDVARKIDGLGR